MIENVVRGALQFSKSLTSVSKEVYLALANNAKPGILFITCMDSRVSPSAFTAMKTGESYFLRNPGNIVPHSKLYEHWSLAEPAALEVACVRSNVNTVIVCGHSDCKAMDGLHSLGGGAPSESSFVLDWVHKFASSSYTALEKIQAFSSADPSAKRTLIGFSENGLKFEAYIDHDLSPSDQLSQVNTLQQILHINSYQFMKKRIDSNEVNLYAMWFHIKNATCHVFNRKEKSFTPIQDDSILNHLSELQINSK